MDEKYGDKIFELKEQGYSYAKIFELFEKSGINIKRKSIVRICRKKYAEVNRSVPKPKRDNSEEMIELPLQEVFELRRSGKTYEEIAQYYRDKGIDVSRESIRHRIKKYGTLQGISQIRKENLPIDEIMYLREKKGLKYDEIIDYYKGEGIELKKTVVMELCREKLKSDNHKLKRGAKLNKQIDDEDIYQLKKMGLTYKQIVEIYKLRGIEVSMQTIQRRCGSVFKEKGEQIPQVKRCKEEKRKTEQDLRELNESLNEMLSKKIKSEDLLKEYRELLNRQDKGEEHERI